MNEYTIVVENLTKRFGDFVAVDDVSFTVGHGEVYGWLGPNGAGKTTTIRMLLGLLKPTSGQARVLGYDPATQAKTMQAHVGYMSQLFTLYTDLTVAENIRFYGQAYGLSRRALRRHLAEIIEMAGLQGRENELTASLSGGWKQRLALGCAIIHDPQVVFLDEPTAGVDPISRREFWELIYDMAERGPWSLGTCPVRQVQGPGTLGPSAQALGPLAPGQRGLRAKGTKGVTVLVTTHYMDEAELCQRVGFISQGRLIALDTPDQLKRTQMRGQVLEIDCTDSGAAMRLLQTARESGQLPLDEVALYGALIHAVVPNAEAFKAPIAGLLAERGVSVNAIEWIAPTLEDVFISSVKAREE